MNWRTLKKLGTSHARAHRVSLRRHDWAEQRHEAAIEKFLNKFKNIRFVMREADKFRQRWPNTPFEECVPYLSNAFSLRDEAWCWARFLTRRF